MLPNSAKKLVMSWWFQTQFETSGAVGKSLDIIFNHTLLTSAQVTQLFICLKMVLRMATCRTSTKSTRSGMNWQICHSRTSCNQQKGYTVVVRQKFMRRFRTVHITVMKGQRLRNEIPAGLQSELAITLTCSTICLIICQSETTRATTISKAGHS